MRKGKAINSRVKEVSLDTSNAKFSQGYDEGKKAALVDIAEGTVIFANERDLGLFYRTRTYARMAGYRHTLERALIELQAKEWAKKQLDNKV